MIAVAKTASYYHLSPKAFPILKQQAPFLFASQSTRDRKLSSVCFRNFPALLLTAAGYSQPVSGKLKSPVRTRATDLESSPNCLQSSSPVPLQSCSTFVCTPASECHLRVSLLALHLLTHSTGLAISDSIFRHRYKLLHQLWLLIITKIILNSINVKSPATF